MIVLGIETSCDETSASVLEEGDLRSNVISSQMIHQEFGGVVPEIASRIHQKVIIPVVEKALSDGKVTLDHIEAIAVTQGPGLVGCLLVGVNFAKGLSLSLDIPFVGVNHIEGHIWSPFVEHKNIGLPFVCLIVSGGHTQLVLVNGLGNYRLLGRTRDDAAGEAFDKVGKLLGFAYPAGAKIDQLAKEGNADFFRFPRSYLKGDNFDFSFSGLKTAVLRYLQNQTEEYIETHLADICASFQQAVVDVLVKKTITAARKNRVQTITLVGGVAANSALRERLKEEAARAGCRLYFPSIPLCTDNAGMIAYVGHEKLKQGIQDKLNITAHPALSLESI